MLGFSVRLGGTKIDPKTGDVVAKYLYYNKKVSDRRNKTIIIKGVESRKI